MEVDKFHKTLIFTKVPLYHHYRFKDDFQIYPAHLENMPKSEFQADFPAILEFKTNKNDLLNIDSEDIIFKEIDSLLATKLTKEKEILNLLTLFSNNRFFTYENLKGFWGINMPNIQEDFTKEINDLHSRWTIPRFYWKDLSQYLKLESLTNEHLKFPKMKFKSHFDYYEKNPNIDFDSNDMIIFPNTFEVGVKKYYSLNTDVKKIIDTAILFFIDAVELIETKPTIAVVSAFTAIETMVNFYFSDFIPEKCECCGQLKYKISKKYKDFLIEVVGGDLRNKSKFNKLYSLRSKIIHTGSYFKSQNLWNNLSRQEKDSEFLTIYEILTLSRLSIVNWILFDSK